MGRSQVRGVDPARGAGANPGLPPSLPHRHRWRRQPKEATQVKILAAVAVLLGIGLIAYAAAIGDPQLPKAIGVGGVDTVLGAIVLCIR